MAPRFFKSPSDLRRWFEKNAAVETELLVGYDSANGERIALLRR